jgi:hypothetical protein
MGKLSAKETVARVFPSDDQTMAGSSPGWIIAGIRSSKKDQVSVLPPDSSEAEHRRELDEVH